MDGKGDPIVLRGHIGGVVSAAFSPDGQRVVTASLDGTARVWRTDGKGEPLVLKGHSGGVRRAAFSPDGERVVTASMDKTARIWSLSIHTVQEQLRRSNDDCLPVEARQPYLGESEPTARQRYEACERSRGRAIDDQPLK
jgi:WD40 repeat protein